MSRFDSIFSRCQIKEIQDELNQLKLPMGWCSGIPDGFSGWFGKVAGLFFTALAVSLEAPFWFDVLNKLFNLRSATKS